MNKTSYLYFHELGVNGSNSDSRKFATLLDLERKKYPFYDIRLRADHIGRKVELTYVEKSRLSQKIDKAILTAQRMRTKLIVQEASEWLAQN